MEKGEGDDAAEDGKITDIRNEGHQDDDGEEDGIIGESQDAVVAILLNRGWVILRVEDGGCEEQTSKQDEEDDGEDVSRHKINDFLLVFRSDEAKSIKDQGLIELEFREEVRDILRVPAGEDPFKRESSLFFEG